MKKIKILLLVGLFLFVAFLGSIEAAIKVEFPAVSGRVMGQVSQNGGSPILYYELWKGTQFYHKLGSGTYTKASVRIYTRNKSLLDLTVLKGIIREGLVGEKDKQRIVDLKVWTAAMSGGGKKVKLPSGQYITLPPDPTNTYAWENYWMRVKDWDLLMAKKGGKGTPGWNELTMLSKQQHSSARTTLQFAPIKVFFAADFKYKLAQPYKANLDIDVVWE